MKKAFSRSLSLLICLTMLLGILTNGGFAAEKKAGTLTSAYASYAAPGHTNDPVTDTTYAVTGDTVKISVLTTTDMHGRAYDWNSYTNSALTNNLLQAAELIAKRRAEADDSIVVDNGDILQGSALSSFNNTQETGENSPIAIALRGIGYDIFNLGNHEFNYSPEIQWNYYNALTSTDADATGKPVDVICANIVEKETQKSVFAPYKLFPYHFEDGTEFTIGVISFENMNNANWDVASHYEGCDFAHASNTEMSYVYEYETYWKQELESKCDYIIVMQHTGEGNGTNYSQENQGAWFIGHTTGVDLLITGHSHGARATTIANADGTNIPVINAGGSNVGELQITLTNTAGNVQVSCGDPTLYPFSTASRPTNTDGPTYQSPTSTEYNEIKALLKDAFDKADAFVNTTIGTVSGKWDDVTRYHYAQGDSYDVVHKAQIWAATTSYGLDTTKNHVVSITTPVVSGSFSFGQLLSGGKMLANVSLRDCYSLYKYDNNTLFMIKMTGEKLMKWMQRTANTFRVNASSGNVTGAGFGTDQFYGVNYKIYLGNEAGKRVTDVTYADGTPVKATDEIYVCLSSYRLSATEGSDSYGWFDSTGITSNSPEVVWDATISNEFNTVGGSVPLIVGEYVKSLTEQGVHVRPGRETNWEISTDEDPWTEIRTFETTDVHGYLMDSSSGNTDTFQYRMAYLAKVFADARTSGDYDDVLLLDGGDIYQGTPLSNLLFGNALRAAYDKMDYDAVCLGNHEFDWDVTTYAAADGTMPAYEIGDYRGDSDIAVLAYNLYDTGTINRASFVKDYVILDKAGVKIAVIGYIPDYTGDIMAEKINPYDIDPNIDRLKEKIAAVNEAESPDVTVVLAHASPKSLANALSADDVDLVLGGHSHSASYGTADNGIAYIQGNCQAQGYASATIKYNKDTGDVVVAEPNYTSITGNKADLYDTEGNDKLDPTVLDISKLSWDAVKDDMGEVLGTVDQSITRRVKIENSTSTIAGNWTAGLMLEATKDLKTVAAFCNSGGIRCDLLVPEGETTRDITVGDIYTISPFGNHILTYEVTGAELAQQVLNGFKNANYGDQFSGMKATYTREEESVDPDTGRTKYTYSVVSITLDDGTMVDINDTEKTYIVCVNEYCATLGGSVFEKKTPIQSTTDAPIDNLSMIEVLRAIGKANDGKLPLDLTPRCTPYTAPDIDPCDSFDDIDTNKWYHDAVHFVLENDLMRGVTKTSFEPNGTMTRAMMVTVLYRIAGEPEVTTQSSFTDVAANRWYSAAIAWAKEENIVKGVTADLFAPNDPISREQVTTIIWRYLKSPESDEDLSTFTDANEISKFAKGAMAWAVEKGILVGEFGKLKPTKDATRAEFATIIMRYLNSIAR